MPERNFDGTGEQGEMTEVYGESKKERIIDLDSTCRSKTFKLTYEPDAFINRFGPVLFMIYRDHIASLFLSG